MRRSWRGSSMSRRRSRGRPASTSPRRSAKSTPSRRPTASAVPRATAPTGARSRSGAALATIAGRRARRARPGRAASADFSLAVALAGDAFIIPRMTGRLGATYLGDGRTRFEVWAPRSETVAVHLLAPSDRVVALARRGEGYHEGTAEGVEPGARYLLRLASGAERPDPASRFQPYGVHGSSVVVD